VYKPDCASQRRWWSTLLSLMNITRTRYINLARWATWCN